MIKIYEYQLQIPTFTCQCDVSSAQDRSSNIRDPTINHSQFQKLSCSGHTLHSSQNEFCVRHVDHLLKKLSLSFGFYFPPVWRYASAYVGRYLLNNQGCQNAYRACCSRAHREMTTNQKLFTQGVLWTQHSHHLCFYSTYLLLSLSGIGGKPSFKVFWNHKVHG